MVSAPSPHEPGAEDFYDQVQDRWPDERPSRRRRKQRQAKDKRVVVHAVRREQPDAARMSRALLAAQRELEVLRAEAEARRSDEEVGT